MPLLAFLRDVGKHVTVNQMLARESVRARIESEHGISYTEFSYMLLQAYDYWWLHEHHGCELQIGGSDQWGNILSGVDLIRRKEGVTVHALCWPLLTAADGTKLGKTTGARIWLDPDRTSPYELYQHFIQTDDRQVRQLLAWLTLLPVDEIDEIVAAARGRTGATRRRSGCWPGRSRRSSTATRPPTEPTQGTTAFGDGLEPEVLRELETTMPTTDLLGPSLPARVVDLLVRTGLAASKSAAARLIRQGGAYATTGRWTRPRTVVERRRSHRRPWLLLRAGKRHRHLVVVAG